MTQSNTLQRIQAILNKEWNPIGLLLTESDDEYRLYAKDIASRKWKEKDLCDYLIKAETIHIGLRLNEERRKKITAAAKNIVEVIG